MIGRIYEKAFSTYVAELIRLDADVRSGNDPQALHDARVALRRLRSYLRTFRRILDADWAEDLRERLRWLDRRLGQARDLDVIVERLGSAAFAAVPADVRQRARKLRDDGHATVQAALRDRHYGVLLGEAIAAAKAPRLTPAAWEAARKAMPQVLRAAWKRVRKRVRAYDAQPSDASLHAIRIAAKRVRYAAECFEERAGKPAKRLARRSERLQKLLGDYHDAVMVDARLAELGAPLLAHVAGRARPQWRGTWREMAGAYERLIRSAR